MTLLMLLMPLLLLMLMVLVPVLVLVLVVCPHTFQTTFAPTLTLLAPLAASPAQQVLPGNVMATCNAQLATTHRPRHCRRCALTRTSIIA